MLCHLPFPGFPKPWYQWMCDAVSLPSPSLLWLNAAHFSHKVTLEHRSQCGFYILPSMFLLCNPDCSFVLFCFAFYFFREKREDGVKGNMCVCVYECTRWVKCTPGHMCGSQRTVLWKKLFSSTFTRVLEFEPKSLDLCNKCQPNQLSGSFMYISSTWYIQFFVVISTGSRSPLLCPSSCSLETVDFYVIYKGKGCGLHHWDSLHSKCHSSHCSCEHTKAFWVQSVTSSTAVCSTVTTVPTRLLCHQMSILASPTRTAMSSLDGLRVLHSHRGELDWYIFKSISELFLNNFWSNLSLCSSWRISKLR